jgi:hypothetical protein
MFVLMKVLLHLLHASPSQSEKWNENGNFLRLLEWSQLLYSEYGVNYFEANHQKGNCFLHLGDLYCD